MIGLVIIVFFIIIAVGAPVLGKNDPIAKTVGSAYDIPSWATVLPQYGNVPDDQQPLLSTFASQSDISSWVWAPQNVTLSQSGVVPSTQAGFASYPGSVMVNASASPDTPTSTDPNLPDSVVMFSMNTTFQFSGPPPSAFEASVVYQPIMMNVTRLYIHMVIVTPSGANFSMASIRAAALAQQIIVDPSQKGYWSSAVVSSGLLPLSGITAYKSPVTPPKLIFTQAGTYKFSLIIEAVPSNAFSQPSVSMRIASVGLHLDGGAYGNLGTDNYGRDVWSQFVWGSQISLLIGILSGIGAVALGALAGITSGYLGGIWDQIIDRTTDFFLVLPFLPLLIIVTTLLVGNAALYNTIYVWVILIFVILSWPSIAKIIRAQVLSVKERSYVEASRAVGGGTGHILRKHILPNVMGLVYSQVALNVGGFILLEAALDFLSISTHGVKTITWGLMLTYALPYAVHNANLGYVWWWFFPPGIAIALLSLAFVLVGFALDSIFNPRLRAR
jgi:peptide/nickel transport system permease protein